MGTSYREVGGGPAVGLAQELINLLQSGLGGNFSAGGSGAAGGGQPSAISRVDQSNPVGRTQGIASVLNDIIAGGAGRVGGALEQIFGRQTTRDVGDIRARFGAAGGTAFGTPAAYAESLYRAEAAPRATAAIGELQMNTIMQLLGMATQLSGRGLPQRQTVARPSGLTSALGTIAPIASALAPFLSNTGLGLNLPNVDTSGFDPSTLGTIPYWTGGN